MSTIAMPKVASFGYGYAPWIGVSQEAEYLRNTIYDATEFSHSITIGESRRNAAQALADLYSASQEEGAVAVESTTFLYAEQFLQLLPSNIPIPDSDIDTDGEILFEWDLGPRHVITVTVGRDGKLNYAALIGYTKKVHGTEYIGETLPLDLSDAFERLYASAPFGGTG